MISVRVLASKFRTPVQQAASLPRHQISQRIRSAPAAKLILMQGPAGFGKTTTMLQYFEQLQAGGTAVAWLNLDDEDNEFEHFLAHLTLIFDRMAAATPGAIDPASAPLIHRIAELDQPFVLFFDECEHIHSPVVLDFLRRMIKHLPESGRLVIGSRNVPNLGLGRLRVNHQLLEIGPAQLRFSLEESIDFFRSKQGLSLSGEDVKLLHRHTEGWAAALHLASLSLASHGNRQHFIATFSGSHAGLADYLAEDVLERLPSELQTFLLRTCVLNELCVPLCAAVSGDARAGELLARLESAHLFLMPLDEERRWYRYHALFADFLRAQLRQRHPEWIAGLHRAASRWYTEQGDRLAAIEYALSSQDTAEALALLNNHGRAFVEQSRFALLAGWYSALPPGAFDFYPQLRLTFAWALAYVRRGSEAISLIEGLSSASTESSPDADTQLSCVAIRALSQIMSDQLEACYQTCATAPPPLLEKPSFAGSHVAVLRTIYLGAAGRFAEAAQAITEIRRHDASAQALGSFSSRTMVDCLLSSADLTQGRLRDAEKRLRKSTAEWIANPRRELTPGSIMNVQLAELLYQCDELAEAERLLTEYLPLVIEVGMPDLVIAGHIVLARIAYAQQDRSRALQVLSALEHLGHRERLPRLVASHWLERSRIALLEGDVAHAKAYWVHAGSGEVWERLRGLVRHANDVDTPEIAHLRLLIRSERCDEALPELKRQLHEASEGGRHRRVLKLRILLSEALHGLDQDRASLRVLRDAVRQAGREGFVRTFVEEGATVARLLLMLRQAAPGETDLDTGAPELPEFIDHLLQVCGMPAATTDSCSWAEASPTMPAGRLTRSEQRVLELLAQGLTNASIAEKLFVALSTVNAHLRNINAKLGVHSRAQAVAVAQRQGLIGHPSQDPLPANR